MRVGQQHSSPNGDRSAEACCSRSDPVAISASPSPACAGVGVSCLLVTVHGLFDVPRMFTQVDASREQCEVVLQIKAKYHKHEHRITCLTLPDVVIPFSPADILFKQERFILDLDDEVQRSRSADTSVTHPSDENSSRYSAGGSVTKDSAQLNDMEVVSSSAHPVAEGVTPLGNSVSEVLPHVVTRQSNQALLCFPSCAGIKAIIQVSAAVRRRRIESGAVIWITPSSEDPGLKSVSTFVVAEGEVLLHKVVNRFVGLQVGHLSCSVSLPYVRTNLSRVPNSSMEVQAAAARLAHDDHRLRLLHPSAGAKPASLTQLVEQLKSGSATEFSLYRAMLLRSDPSHYVKRVQRILDMYPPVAPYAGWVKGSATELLEEYIGREEELIQALSIELGPETRAISPRYRREAYRWKYRLTPEDIRKCVADKLGAFHPDLIDYEPDLCMSILVQRYGKEVKPTEYIFPTIYYSGSTRPTFRDMLRFPHNKLDKAHREYTIRARTQRVPLKMTPNERPLKMPVSRSSGSSSSRGGEIDILLEKYRTEFEQIIPSVADAMTTIVCENEQYILEHKIAPDTRFSIFNSDQSGIPFNNMLTRMTEYTYISPSSLIAALIFLDRLCTYVPTLFLTRYNIEKLLITATRIASKVVDLRSVNNRNFASVFMLPVGAFNTMEDLVLKRMNFDFFLTPDEFYCYTRLLDPDLAEEDTQRCGGEQVWSSRAKKDPVVEAGSPMAYISPRALSAPHHSVYTPDPHPGTGRGATSSSASAFYSAGPLSVSAVATTAAIRDAALAISAAPLVTPAPCPRPPAAPLRPTSRHGSSGSSPPRHSGSSGTVPRYGESTCSNPETSNVGTNISHTVASGSAMARSCTSAIPHTHVQPQLPRVPVSQRLLSDCFDDGHPGISTLMSMMPDLLPVPKYSVMYDR